ncbi:MAG: glycerol-3-phosphate 1-O-acyltransferase PlsY [Bacteroidia bacterium]|jgi:glycerol-3-phosphate acyltransferase PlsY|nr:glycerol-3-phosphate 1-O-acyltransferase PlsY [Bacteroidia bacterium]
MMGYILPIIVGYLLGSIPTAVWVGKWFYGIDVRTRGSGNAGATNTIRVLGVKAGIPVIIVDVLKGYLAVAFSPALAQWGGLTELPPSLEILAAAASVIGHTLPVFAGFRGGKGVATLLGAGIGLFPVASWLAVAVFIISLMITRYVSFSSMLAGFSFTLMVLLFFPPPHWAHYILAIAVSVFLPITHRKNIRRLIEGTESKVNFKKKPAT